MVTFRLTKNIMPGETRKVVRILCSNKYTTPDSINLKTEIPQQPADLINLYPVPFVMDENHIIILKEKAGEKLKN